MTTAGLRVILDDNAPDFKYSGGDWTLSTLVQWYSQTSNYPGFATDTVFGSFTLEFEGTSIAFIGNTPENFFAESQIATVSIDGGRAYNTTYGTTAPPAYVQWYQSPTLADGKHNITISHLAGTAVDLALITVGPKTSLQGKTLIVDDDNSAIQYSGTWSSNTSPFNAGTLPDGFPVGNSTHRSTTLGDTITFRFTGESIFGIKSDRLSYKIGTSVSVYGIFSWVQVGSLTATYTLDGTTVPQTYSVTTRSPQFMEDYGEASNYILFSSETLAAGDHTLVINITQCINQTFILDYITYAPSFSALASMPNLTNSPTTTASSSSAPSVLANGSQVSHSNTETKKVPIGAIVGGVGGGILIFLLVGFLMRYLRRRRASDMENLRPDPLLARNRGHDANCECIFLLSRNTLSVMCLDANSGGSPPMMLVSPGQDFSHTSDTISPFPNGPTGHASMVPVNIKRGKLDSSNIRTAAPRFPSEARGDNVSLDASRPSGSPELPITSAENVDDQGGVPPAYDNLSVHRYSNLP
ncbi:hypothetical protein M413DRAFT_422146 [Hebeloma cylindrosporum]|uniref:Transmembrane protein n=1 Tax=Hebeloma cylindrosporum TaxID=76867 RepID=A0A0C3CDC1_HEBCY|nr:hypothetical protein M413DRAFT_422146 [Hebeloma cylindrosporum h7]